MNSLIEFDFNPRLQVSRSQASRDAVKAVDDEILDPAELAAFS
jgi:hypothetical protein